MKLSDAMHLEHSAINKWMGLKDRCDTKKFEFSLTVADVRRLLTTRYCYYTGIDMQEAKDSGNTQHCRSIDRVDSSKGYVKGNVVACSTTVNKLKGDLTLKQIKQLTRRWEKFEKRGNK